MAKYKTSFLVAFISILQCWTLLCLLRSWNLFSFSCWEFFSCLSSVLSPGLTSSCCCCSVAQSCLTLCDPMDLSFTISWSLLKLMCIESVMPSSHLFFCHPLHLLPSIFPSIRVFSDELALRIRWPKYWSFSFS